ncbi:MAG TPA: hypothetical protein VF230_06255 [Acidimicrobiales bacterium]
MPLAVYAFLGAGAAHLVAQRFYGYIDVAFDELGVSTWHLFTGAAHAGLLAIIVVTVVAVPGWVLARLSWARLHLEWRASSIGAPAAAVVSLALFAAGAVAGWSLLRWSAAALPDSVSDGVLVIAGVAATIVVVELVGRGAEPAQTPLIFMGLTLVFMWLGGLAGAPHAADLIRGEMKEDDLGALVARLLVSPTGRRVCIDGDGTAHYYLGGSNGTAVLLSATEETVLRVPTDATTMTSATCRTCFEASCQSAGAGRTAQH